MLRIGVTGGIGSGKSSVCEVFSQLGIPVFHADIEARALYDNNAALRLKICDAFGTDIYQGAVLNRQKLSEIVFSNKEKLQELNAMVHPIIFDLYEKWCDEQQHFSYTIKEAAIMFESGSHRHLHLVIGVMADEEIRIQRVIDRDHLSREEIIRRMRNQMDQEALKKRCDYIIDNNGSESLLLQVTKLNRELRDLSRNGLDFAFKS